MSGLPSGTVTLLFTDIEGSTRLLLRLGAAYPAALDEHRRLLFGAIQSAGGRVLDTQGDACFASFGRASEAVVAAAATQRALAAHRWPDGVRVRVRLGIHTGEPTVTATGYAGLDVHRAARICSAGHGGQVLMSSTSADLVGTTLSPDLSLTELGSYRFKDFSFAERVYQLNMAGLPTSFPPPRSLDVSHRLPTQYRTLIGRDRELADCRRLLLDPETRLLTLTGAGGSGKTRLAVALADGAQQAFEDGVCFVSLASVTDARQVPSSVAQALGVRDVLTQQPRDLVVDVLSGREQLLILDNFEQILDAATFVADVLAACPRVRVLATSREPLHLTGEREYSVAPLELPATSLHSARQIYELAAPRLFVERAVEAKRDFVATDADAEVIAEICRRLDGLPLAIELAAARIRFLSPSALLGRLGHSLAVLTGGPRDLPARQQTLRAAIAWSHDLLDERDRTVFRRASVFVDTWSLEAGEAICSLDDDPLATLDALSSLVDKSLLRREESADGDARLRMLATIREFARGQLEASGELASIQRRHADHYLSVAEEAAPHLAVDANQLAWIERLDAERTNVAIAFSWSQGDTDDAARVDIGLRLSAALWHYWAVRSNAAEAQTRIAAILALAAHGPASSARGQALHGASILARDLSDYDATERLLRESLASARALHEPQQIADVLNNLGWLAVLRGDSAGARALLHESLALFQRLGDVHWKAVVLTRLGYVAFMEGDVLQAQRMGAEGATVARVMGDPAVLSNALVYLGLAQQYGGDLEQSRRCYEECLTLARPLGDRHLIAMALNMLGQLAVTQKSLDEASRLLREAVLLAREVGNVRRLSFLLAAVATLANARGDAEFAVRLDAASQSAAQSVGTVRAQAARANSERMVAAARAHLGATAADAAHDAGRQLSVEQAVSAALTWLGEDASEAAVGDRWQRSPWTVFGWSTGGPLHSPGADATRPSRHGTGSLPVYGEGGTVPPR